MNKIKCVDLMCIYGDSMFEHISFMLVIRNCVSKFTIYQGLPNPVAFLDGEQRSDIIKFVHIETD